MARLISHLDHAIFTVGLAVASLQGVAVRISYVGITGIILELCGRFALTAFHAVLGQLRAPHGSAS